MAKTAKKKISKKTVGAKNKTVSKKPAKITKPKLAAKSKVKPRAQATAPGSTDIRRAYMKSLLSDYLGKSDK